MKFLILLLALQQFVPIVVANWHAGPYTAMLAWYVYSMEAQYKFDDKLPDKGRSNFRIARDCKGSLAGGRCGLEEFLKHIEGKVEYEDGTVKPPWGGLGGTVPAIELFPDLEQTAARLRADEYGFVANQHKLLPVAFPNPRGRTPRFSEVYDVIADIFDEIRGDQNVVKETKFQQEIQQTRTAIQRTRIARRIDLEKKKIKDYNDILADMGYKWRVRSDSQKDPVFGKWRQFNLKATKYDDRISGGTEAGSRDIEKILNSIEIDYKRNDKGFFVHDAALRASTRYRDRMLTDVPCGKSK